MQAGVRPIRDLGVTAASILAVYALVELFAVLAGVRRVSELTHHIDHAGSASPSPGDPLYKLSMVVRVLMFLVAAAVFLAWLFEARRNACAITPVRHRRGMAWLFLGWVTPVVSFWFPRQVVEDIWHTSRPGRLRVENLAHARRSALVTAWWAFWLLATMFWPLSMGFWLFSVGRDIFGAAVPEVLPVSLRLAAEIDVGTTVLSLIATLLAIALVLRITAFQASSP
jgi:hypothetical protein